VRISVRTIRIGAWCCALALLPLAAAAETILDTKHNLSVTGPGTIKALSETRVCVFCHTPHNATPKTPLWNREIGAQTYLLYANPPTLRAAPGQPLGPSRLCLSCHDGMIALGAVLRPAAGIAMSGPIPAASASLIGSADDLSRDHPFSFRYLPVAAADPEIRAAVPAGLTFYNGDDLECPTCHDPHKDAHRSPDRSGTLTGKFLPVSNRYSGLCVSCHDIAGWVGSTHQSSTAPVDGAVLPVAPRQWPTWTTLAEWGCESCHAPHGSASGPLLLLFATEAATCAPCHGGIPGNPHTGDRRGDLAGGAAKPSAHRMTARRARAPDVRTPADAVTCSDCHNAHVAARRTVTAPARTGAAAAPRGVSGLDGSGVPLAAATYEYEVCFKCHADRSDRQPFVVRVVSTTDARRQFDPANASFHPVVGRGRGTAVPSLPSPAEPGLTPASLISCTDCHRDDGGGTRGPHGSAFAPILRERCESADHTAESAQSYALCYRCHDRAKLLADTSFRRRPGAGGGGHSGHLASGAPCSVCHDAHGVPDMPGTGDHTSLINFDVTIVKALAGEAWPQFESRGRFAGACTLVCHGRAHRGESYP
jgi:predicted CXXCH cytochrome family protein